jgi:hypothetical protein
VLALNLLVTLIFFATAAAQPHVWFVDNARPAEGDGTLAAPFRSIAAASSASQTGDVIYVFHGTEAYREPVVLREGQLLAGEGSDVAGVPARPAAPPVIDGGAGDAVTLAAGSSVSGVTLRGAHALVAANAGGNVAVRRTSLEGPVSIDGGNGAMVFEASPVAGTLAVRNRAGGSVAFRNGSSVTGANVTLHGNMGELTFADPLRLTADGAVALRIQSSGRVTISSPGSAIVARRAPAAQIADTGIAIRLQWIDADAAGASVPSALSLDNARGTFRLDGGTIRGAAARAVSVTRSSGVTLQKLVIEKSAAGVKPTPACAGLAADKDAACGAAVFLGDSDGVVLDGVRIGGSGQFGIYGDNVSNLTLRGVAVTDAGDEAGEHGIALRGLHGRSLFVQTTVKDSAARQLFIANRDGEGTLEIRASRFDGAPPPNGGQAMLVQLGGEAKFALSVTDSDFVDAFSDAVHVIAEGSAQADVTVTGSRFAHVNAAVDLVALGEARLGYRIAGNTATGASAAAINVNLSTTKSSSVGTIADNVIGKSGLSGSGAKCGGCSGIAFSASRAASADVTISGNTIQQVDGSGVRVVATGGAVVRATVRGNIIREPAGDGVSAVVVQSGSRPADQTRLCLDLAENQVTGGWDVGLTSKGAVPMRLVGVTSAAERAVAARNKGAAVKLNPAAGGSFAPAASCGEK